MEQDPYTCEPTHLRIFSENGEWFLDGVNDTGHYTEGCWSFDSHAEAVEAIPDFLRIHDNYLWRFRPGRRGPVRFRS